MNITAPGFRPQASAAVGFRPKPTVAGAQSQESEAGSDPYVV
jgi:hypothetical protein